MFAIIVLKLREPYVIRLILIYFSRNKKKKYKIAKIQNKLVLYIHIYILIGKKWTQFWIYSYFD